MIKNNQCIRLNILPFKAKPNSSLSSILGQKGININSFCKEYNKLTKDYKIKIPLRVLIIYTNKVVTNIIVKQPSISIILKQLLKLNKLYSKYNPLNMKVSKLIIIKIVKLKINDFNSFNIRKCIFMVVGTIKTTALNYEKELL